MDFLCFMNILAYILVPSLKVSMAVDSVAHSQFISDGMTLVSQGGTFELGFFSPGNSNKRYLGIWYKNIPIQTVVWVANRLNPINNSFGTLAVNSTGNLVLSQNDTVVWYSTIISQKQAQNPAAKLLDSGNLVVCDEKEEANPEAEAYLWQSFDYPSDTLLPGMKLGWDLKKGLDWSLTAWKSPNDPAPGDFSCVQDHNSYPDLYLMKGTKKYSRFGPWNGIVRSGNPQVENNSVYDFDFVHNKDEIYYTYHLKNSYVLSRVVMNQTDYTRYRYVWAVSDQNWRVYSVKPVDYCDLYGLCGANGNCIITETPVCGCLKGFRPKSQVAWNSLDWSQGCVRNKPLSCKDKHMDGFVKMTGMKVPDTTYSWLDETMGLEECRARCLNNCSCMAYTNSDVTGGGSGCAMWFGDLIDSRQFYWGQDLYIRMAASELEVEEYGHRRRLITIVATTIAGMSGTLLISCYCICKVCGNKIAKSRNIEDNEGPEDDLDLPLISLSKITGATNNFSINNTIGQGGFGPVYRGTLDNGKIIAVKRLSSSSGQGMTEFKNEVKLIARLQHRNLVKLLGCCIEGQEQMLVYEYMPNNSLDSIIFDHTKGKLLDWSKRFHIIYGIARGLIYLHQDSGLRIIHRDLKASNVLLDDKLNPKISNFGMAKSFGGEQTEGNTNRVVGTYGYMAPEYITNGLFSTKSDVFSFGILVMEIIHGKRNRGFSHLDYSHNLIGHAWILWMEGRALELIDKNIEESMTVSEVMRCIHVSLLCAQRHPEDRPSMSSVLLTLESEIEIPEPKQPGFFLTNDALQANSTPNQVPSVSINEITMTLLEAR